MSSEVFTYVIQIILFIINGNYTGSILINEFYGVNIVNVLR